MPPIAPYDSVCEVRPERDRVVRCADGLDLAAAPEVLDLTGRAALITFERARGAR